MKGILIVLTLIVMTTIDAGAQNKSPIQLIREDLFYSEFNLNKCFEFYNRITGLQDTSPIMQAYEAVAEALIAKHSWNPVTKVNYLNSSQKLLQEAVLRDKLNVEIRFLRFYIENSVPAYLGMSKNKKLDKQLIIENLESLKSMDLGEDIINYIINYITSPEVSSKEEIATIKSKIVVD
ncbi:hypothetical protein E1176_19305 [Fulvivirga sp. RKSG066]|uniref:hypothetical protein n=1 Tax=Fulvivirga aurantia TaxID=2529383 RepID=UPI0012BB74BA|nr:hypothetical protein [Fulvivirga aurantia]MTI23186.1 hypothetical protein [Fulvivirga aurantia]